MKCNSTREGCILSKIPTRNCISFIVFCLLLLITEKLTAQSYFSNFTTATGNFNATAPGGIICLAPGWTNAQNIANADTTNNHAAITGLVSVALTCNGTPYSLRAKLNFPGGVTQAPGGYIAGFRVQFNSLISIAILRSNISIRTYLGGSLRETTPGTSLLGLDVLSTQTQRTNVYFTTTLSFDEIEIIMNNSVLPIGVGVDNRFYYAFSQPPTVLPITLESFSVEKREGNNWLMWQTTHQAEATKFLIERSLDAVSFLKIGELPVQHSLLEINDYKYEDKNTPNNTCYYRLKILYEDGLSEYSTTIAITSPSLNNTVEIYPNVLTKGKVVEIKINNHQLFKLEVINHLGQLVRITNSVSNNYQLLTGNLKSGSYLLRFSNDKTSFTTKIIVQ